MQFGILVEADVALFLCEYRVVTPHVAILAGKPERAALAEYDVAGDDELGGCPLCAESFAGAFSGLIGAAFCFVGGGAGEVKGKEREPLERGTVLRGECET